MTWAESTRRLETIVGSSVDRSAGAVVITMEDAGARRTQVVLSAAVIPALIAVLVAKLDELLKGTEPREMQTLEATRLRIATSPEGTMALLIGLSGVGNLAVGCDRTLLSSLRTEVEEALQYSDPKGHN